MRAATFDRRIRKEASALLREARAALLHKKELKGTAGDLGEVAADIEKALADHDIARVRRQLPVLDSLVDELVVRNAKSGSGERIESLLAAVALALLLRAFVIEAFKIPSSSMYPTLEIGDHIFVNKFIYGLRIPWTNIKLLEGSPDRGDVIVFIKPCQPDRDYIKRVVAVAGDTVEVRCDVLYVNGVAMPATYVDAPCTHEDRNSDGKWTTEQCSRYHETIGGVTHDAYHRVDRPTRAPGVPGSLDFPNPDGPPASCATDDTDGAIIPDNQKVGEVVVTRRDAGACELQAHYIIPPGHIFAMGDNRANSSDSRVWGPVPIENIKGKALFIWLSYRDSLFDPRSWRWDRFGKFVD